MEQGETTARSEIDQGGAPSLKVEIAVAMLVAALMVWGKPYWLPWLAEKVTDAVQTSAHTGCYP